jgi:hypothetical protein
MLFLLMLNYWSLAAVVVVVAIMVVVVGEAE